MLHTAFDLKKPTVLNQFLPSFSYFLLCCLNLLCGPTEGTIPQFQNHCGFRHSYGKFQVFSTSLSSPTYWSVLSYVRFDFRGNCHLAQILLFRIMKFCSIYKDNWIKEVKDPKQYLYIQTIGYFSMISNCSSWDCFTPCLIIECSMGLRERRRNCKPDCTACWLVFSSGIHKSRVTSFCSKIQFNYLYKEK